MDAGGRAASGTSRRGIQEGDDGVSRETLIQSELPCGIGKCRLKSNNLAMTQVIDFEARAFGELSRVDGFIQKKL